MRTGDRSPALPHVQKLVDDGIEPQFAAFLIIEFETCLGHQPRGANLPRGREEVCVKIAWIAAGKIPRRMNRKVHGKSITVG